MLVGSNQSNYSENKTACRKRTLKTRVATQLKLTVYQVTNSLIHFFFTQIAFSTIIRVSETFSLKAGNPEIIKNYLFKKTEDLSCEQCLASSFTVLGSMKYFDIFIEIQPRLCSKYWSET